VRLHRGQRRSIALRSSRLVFGPTSRTRIFHALVHVSVLRRLCMLAPVPLSGKLGVYDVSEAHQWSSKTFDSVLGRTDMRYQRPSLHHRAQDLTRRSALAPSKVLPSSSFMCDLPTLSLSQHITACCPLRTIWFRRCIATPCVVAGARLLVRWRFRVSSPFARWTENTVQMSASPARCFAAPFHCSTPSALDSIPCVYAPG